jgi:hypothetical protein
MLGPFEGCVIPDQSNLPDPIPPAGQILICEDGATRLQVRLEGRSVWLSQRLIAELFQVSVLTANEHLANIYREGELDPKATIWSFRIVQAEGTREITRAISVFHGRNVGAEEQEVVGEPAYVPACMVAVRPCADRLGGM